MKAGTLDAAAPPAAYDTELGVEARLSMPAAEVASVGEGRWRSVLRTMEALFCRASPSVSGYFYNVLGEDIVDELDD